MFAGIILALMAPFGTHQTMDMSERFAFWILAICAGAFIHVPLYWLAAFFGQEWRLHPLVWLTVSGAVAAAPTTLMVNGVAAALFGQANLDSFARLYPYVLVISLPMQLITYAVERTRHAQPVAQSGKTLVPPQEAPEPRPAEQPVPLSGPDDAPPPAAPDFLARLPARLGRELLCLEMEDHYLRIHTALGNAMVYIRMSDAEAALAGYDGLRVHRSWWVARRAVTSWQRQGKNLTLKLSNQLEVPVARERQSALKAAGWLPQA